MLCSVGHGNSKMGALNTIGYKPGSSILHRLDPRTKQILVMIQSTACFVGNEYYLTAISLCIAYCLVKSTLRPAAIMLEIRYFLFFLLFVFLVRAVTISEHYVPAVSIPLVEAALIFCWRLLLIVMMGVLLISTTRTAEIRAALVWGLKPFPLINERAAATMVGLIVRFLPLMLFQAGEISDAMRARCVEERKNPVYRVTRFTIMLFRRSITRADDLVDSMQARCYSEYRTVRNLQFTRCDLLAAVCGGAILSILFLF